MKLSTQLDYAKDLQTTAAQAKTLEDAGVDMIWVAEAYGYDAVSLLGYLAAVTSRAELASGILPAFSRTPALIAQTAAALDALSGGRFVLGLGASGPQVIEGWHALPFHKPLTRITEIIDICRMAWKRERLEYEGDVFTIPLPADQGTGQGKPLKMITKPLRENIPIHIASLGPKSVEVCAAHAEGWLPFLFAPELASRVWGEPLKAGLARRPAELGSLQITAGGYLAIGDGAERYRDYVRPMAALYIGGMGSRGKNFYNDVCQAYGFTDAARQIQDLYLDGKKEEAAAAVPDELIEKVSLCGPVGYIKERLAAHREAGTTILNVTPVGGDAQAQLSQLRELLG